MNQVTYLLSALLNISMHDGLETSHASKFHYHLWRPVTAIPRAEEDGNPDTEPDPDWTPLLVTPPYPTYAGNAATLGASAATLLASFFGSDEMSIEACWEVADVCRSYPGFWAMAQEQARSRIWGGIHYTFGSTAGQRIGTTVGNYVFGNFMLPLSGPAPGPGGGTGGSRVAADPAVVDVLAGPSHPDPVAPGVEGRLPDVPAVDRTAEVSIPTVAASDGLLAPRHTPAASPDRLFSTTADWEVRI